MKKIALVVTPWNDIRTGSLALSILKSAIQGAGFGCDVFYLNLKLAKDMDLSIYNYLNNTYYIGEWIFSQYLFGKYGTGELKNDFSDFSKFLILESGYTEAGATMRKRKTELDEILNFIPQYIEECINDIPWNDYYIVGFTCRMFGQISSLLLSKKIKEINPEIKIIFGGANVRGIQGKQMIQDFDWIDYIIDGEGEEVFPRLALNIDKGNCYEKLPGVSYRKGNEVFLSDDLPTSVAMDDIPIPDFTDYYRQLEQYGFDGKFENIILAEASRGCWWGNKNQCTFCSDTFGGYKYKSKSPDKVINELKYMSQKYNTNSFFFVDSILDTNYYKTLIPKLLDMNQHFDLFFEIKANTSKSQLKLLKQIGVNAVQPGIENLSTDLLKLMNKGVTSLQNIQLLKFCAELDMEVRWNIIYKIPGEKGSYYNQMLELIPLITHLQPPPGLTTVDLERHSLYFRYPEKYGISEVRPSSFYKYIYPVDKINLENIVFTFDYKCDSFSEGDEEYHTSLTRLVNYWKSINNNNRIVCKYNTCNEGIEIIDSRPLDFNESDNVERRYIYTDLYSEVYILCDSICSYEKILERFSSRLNETGLCEILNEFVSKKLMVCEDGRYLSLAIKND